ncbi:MAG: hypothetical protein OIF34_02585, partial [Porticoccaceae bacterium]|nr:hypothetical protein [Porticoccaceae bacterium]
GSGTLRCLSSIGGKTNMAMGWWLVAVTVASKDAGLETPWMDSRRVTVTNHQLIGTKTITV